MSAAADRLFRTPLPTSAAAANAMTTAEKLCATTMMFACRANMEPATTAGTPIAR